MTELEYAHRADNLKSRLFRTALLWLGSEADALDAVDEAVYRGYLAFKKLKQPEHFDTWLTRILINHCSNELRRRKRVTTMDNLPEITTEQLDTLPLRDAVERLPSDLRAVVVLRYFSGYTLSETAGILGIPAGTVSTRQRKALTLLRMEFLEDEL